MSDASGGSTTETAAVAPSNINDTTTVATSAPADEAATPAAPAGNRRESNNNSSTNSIDPSNIQFNPISRWEEEPVDVIGLTLWDIHSKPRPGDWAGGGGGGELAQEQPHKTTKPDSVLGLGFGFG